MSNGKGSYLHYNTIRHTWIRSGKVVGSDDSEEGSRTTRNFKIRQDEHSHCARYDNKTSRFYSLYPHSEAKSSDNIRRDIGIICVSTVELDLVERMELRGS